MKPISVLFANNRGKIILLLKKQPIYTENVVFFFVQHFCRLPAFLLLLYLFSICDSLSIWVVCMSLVTVRSLRLPLTLDQYFNTSKYTNTHNDLAKHIPNAHVNTSQTILSAYTSDRWIWKLFPTRVDRMHEFERQTDALFYGNGQNKQIPN